MSSPVDDVLAAWRNPGPRPDYHARKKAELMRDWPSLAHALYRLDMATGPDAGDQPH